MLTAAVPRTIASRPTKAMTASPQAESPPASRSGPAMPCRRNAPNPQAATSPTAAHPASTPRSHGGVSAPDAAATADGTAAGTVVAAAAARSAIDIMPTPPKVTRRAAGACSRPVRTP